MKKRKRLWNLWKTITLLVCTVVIFSLLVTDILISHNVERTTEDSQAEKAKTIAHIVANDSIVIDGLIGKTDTAAIQTYTNRILKKHRCSIYCSYGHEWNKKVTSKSSKNRSSFYWGEMKGLY